MSRGEFGLLKQFGTEWHTRVWRQSGSADIATRRDIMTRLNQFLGHMAPGAFLVRQGRRDYDTFVRAQGIQSGTYRRIAEYAAGQADGGLALAREVLSWMTDTLRLDRLDNYMAILVVITSFSEVARGYSWDVDNDFLDWIRSICNANNAATARALWLAYRDYFPPALTYDEDTRQAIGDFVPDSDDDNYSDSDPDAEISEGEQKALIKEGNKRLSAQTLAQKKFKKD